MKNKRAAIKAAIHVGNISIFLCGTYNNWEIIETTISQNGDKRQITTKIIKFNDRKKAKTEFNRRKKLNPYHLP